ncbi:MAG: SRPBCC domain-containing protein [Siphonobacter sp.]
MALTVENSILINAPIATIWDFLVNPEQTKKYMFGCEPITNWQIGSPLLWKGVFDGHELVAVKGEIVKIDPGSYLAYTVIDPNNPAIPDLPENYLTVTYRLSEQDDQTLLEVSQGDYTHVTEGEKRYNDTIAEGGWQSILEQIKAMAENS